MSIPRPIVSVHAEDVDLEIPRLLTIRATFLSEGLFDETAGGDPEEEDMYEVEVTHARDALLEPITFPLLAPSTAPGWLADEEEGSPSLPIERWVLALGWTLANAHPSNWPEVCESARAWDSWMVEDVHALIPPEWTPQPLLPDEE